MLRSPRAPARLLSFLCALLAAGPALGQSLVWTYDGPQGYSSYVPAGDVDGDGVPDLLTGNPGFWQGGLQVGTVRVYSGADGGLIRQWTGSIDDESLGGAVCAAGDVDGDGFGDVWAGRDDGAGGDELLLLSGGTGLQLDVVPGPLGASAWSLLSVGDIDRDGTDDLLVLWADACGPFEAQLALISVAKHQTLATRCNAADGYAYEAITTAGDLDGDGLIDVLLRTDDATGGEGVDAVSVLSGADLSTLLEIVHDGPSVAQFGSAVAGGQDVDGDGVPDVVVGARQDDHGGEWMGAVYVYSGADASLLTVIDGNQFYEQFGAVVGLPGDLTGDGLADVVVQADAYELEGELLDGLLIFRSSDWQLVRAVDLGLPPQAWSRLVAAGDVDGDGRADLYTYGRPAYAPPAQVVELWLVAGQPLLAPGAGGALAGLAGLPRLTAEGSLHNETPLTLKASLFLPGAPVAVVTGFTALDLPFKGGTLVPSPDSIVYGIPADGLGELELVLQMPITLPPGFEIFVQLWAPDVGGPAGFAATNAVRLANDG